MADPVTWVMAISAVVGAIGAMSSADAKASSLNQQAQIADRNAVISQQAAQNSNDVAQANAASEERRRNYALSESRAAIGQSGTGFDGSNADVLGQSAANSALDVLKIKYDGVLRGRAYTDQSLMDSYSASSLRTQADNAETAGTIGAASSLLGGASSYLNAGSKVKATKLSNYSAGIDASGMY